MAVTLSPNSPRETRAQSCRRRSGRQLSGGGVAGKSAWRLGGRLDAAQVAFEAGGLGRPAALRRCGARGYRRVGAEVGKKLRANQWCSGDTFRRWLGYGEGSVTGSLTR